MMRGVPAPDALTGTNTTSPISGRPAAPWLRTSATTPATAEMICCTAGSEPSGSCASPTAGTTLASAVDACSRISSTRNSWPPRNSMVRGAPPGGKGVPCSIDGGANAAEVGGPCAFCCGGRPELPAITWYAIAAATSSTAVAPASRRQGAARRRPGSLPPLMTSEASSSGTLSTYSRIVFRWRARADADISGMARYVPHAVQAVCPEHAPVPTGLDPAGDGRPLHTAFLGPY